MEFPPGPAIPLPAARKAGSPCTVHPPAHDHPRTGWRIFGKDAAVISHHGLRPVGSTLDLRHRARRDAPAVRPAQRKIHREYLLHREARQDAAACRGNRCQPRAREGHIGRYHERIDRQVVVLPRIERCHQQVAVRVRLAYVAVFEHDGHTADAVRRDQREGVVHAPHREQVALHQQQRAARTGVSGGAACIVHLPAHRTGPPLPEARELAHVALPAGVLAGAGLHPPPESILVAGQRAARAHRAAGPVVAALDVGPRMQAVAELGRPIHVGVDGLVARFQVAIEAQAQGAPALELHRPAQAGVPDTSENRQVLSNVAGAKLRTPQADPHECLVGAPGQQRFLQTGHVAESRIPAQAGVTGAHAGALPLVPEAVLVSAAAAMPAPGIRALRHASQARHGGHHARAGHHQVLCRFHVGLNGDGVTRAETHAAAEERVIGVRERFEPIAKPQVASFHRPVREAFLQQVRAGVKGEVDRSLLPRDIGQHDLRRSSATDDRQGLHFEPAGRDGHARLLDPLDEKIGRGRQDGFAFEPRQGHGDAIRLQVEITRHPDATEPRGPRPRQAGSEIVTGRYADHPFGEIQGKAAVEANGAGGLAALCVMSEAADRTRAPQPTADAEEAQLAPCTQGAVTGCVLGIQVIVQQQPGGFGFRRLPGRGGRRVSQPCRRRGEQGDGHVQREALLGHVVVERGTGQAIKRNEGVFIRHRRQRQTDLAQRGRRGQEAAAAKREGMHLGQRDAVEHHLQVQEFVLVRPDAGHCLTAVRFVGLHARGRLCHGLGERAETSEHATSYQAPPAEPGATPGHH